MPSIASNRRRLSERLLSLSLHIASLATLLAIFFLPGQARASTATVRLPHHVPQWAIAQAHLLGAVPDQQTVKLSFVLPLRNQQELNQLLARLYDPKDPLYGHYLTPAQFTAEFGPSQTDIDAVERFAASRGLAVTGVSGNHTIVSAEGPASSVNTAFAVRLRSYSRADGSRFYAPNMDPAVPGDIAGRIIGVLGLDNAIRYRTHLVPKSLLSNGPAAPAIGTGVNGSGLDPTDIAKAYNLAGITQNGTGETLGVIEFDGYTASDVTAYEKAYNLPAVPLDNVAVDGGVPTPGSGAIEVTLDIELQAALAPDVNKIVVYEAPNNGTDGVDILNKAASDNLANAMSMSWGVPEDAAATDPTLYNGEDQALKEMASQGQSFFASSGDSGAFTDPIEPSTPVADDPATQPDATAVGGTTLSINSDGSYKSESTWNELNIGGGSGGGGISTIWPIPSYQSPVVGASSDPELSKTMRNEPDVSLDADPDNSGYSIYFGGQWTTIGGTSCAAPLWAAFTALLDQERVANSLTGIGLINTAIYQIGQLPTSYANDFHDIADFSNNGFYHAEPGYDLTTGLGSFNGANLLADPLMGGLALNAKVTGQVVTVTDNVSSGVSGAAVTETLAGTSEVIAQGTTDGTGTYTLNAPSNSSVTISVTQTNYETESTTVTTGSSGSTTTAPTITLVASPHTFAAAPTNLPYQMVSSPFIYPVGESMADILGALTITAYTWDPTYGEYISPPVAPADTFHLGVGYWLLNTGPLSVSIDGTPDTASTFQINLLPGWNMIGDPFDGAVPTSGITVTLTGTSTTTPYATALKNKTVSDFYTWQPGDQQYEVIDSTGSLNAWEGYWVWAQSAYTLTVPNPSG